MNDVPDHRRTVRVRVTGRVHGVGYRMWAQAQAKALGLDGWVRNMRDGSVEALFSGQAADVGQMLIRCHRGPGTAFVERVSIVQDGASPPSAGFQVLPTA